MSDFIKKYSDLHYGSMYWAANTNAQTIETANNTVALRFLTTGSNLKNFTFTEGKTGAITAYADLGGGEVRVTSNGHGLSSGDIITIRGTTNYNGVFQITKIDDNSFKITDTWVADDGDSDWDRGDYLSCQGNGKYLVSYSASVSEGGAAGSTLSLVVHKNGTAQNESAEEHLFADTNIANISSRGVILTLVPNDRIWLGAKSTGTNAFTFKRGGLTIIRT